MWYIIPVWPNILFEVKIFMVSPSLWKKIFNIYKYTTCISYENAFHDVFDDIDLCC